MRYEVSGKNVDIKKTKVNIHSIYRLDHEYMQYIENYFRAMHGENLDMSKLKFYKRKPSYENAELTPDDAIKQLNVGRPLLVMHSDFKEVVPFLKLQNNVELIYTGQDLLNQPRSKKFTFDFDVEEFKKQPVPKAPGFIAKILNAVGIKTKGYQKYEEYQKKAETLARGESMNSLYDAETEAYSYAKELDENHYFREDLQRIIREHLFGKKKTENNSLESANENSIIEAYDEEKYIEELGNLNINELYKERDEKEKTDGKVKKKKIAPKPTEEQLAKISELEGAIAKRKYMLESEFFKEVVKEITDGNLDDPGKYDSSMKSLEEYRVKYSVPDSISTEAFIEFARQRIDLEKKRTKADKSMKAFKTEQRKYHTISSDEYFSLKYHQRAYFVEQKDHTFIDRFYVDKIVKLGKIKRFSKQNKGQNKESKQIDKNKVERIAKHRKAVNAILKGFDEQRTNQLKDNIARAITNELMKKNENSNEKATYRTVRLGPTLKKMIDTPQKKADLEKLIEENPTELGKLYINALVKEDAKISQESGEAAMQENSIKTVIAEVNDGMVIK